MRIVQMIADTEQRVYGDGWGRSFVLGHTVDLDAPVTPGHTILWGDVLDLGLFAPVKVDEPFTEPKEA